VTDEDELRTVVAAAQGARSCRRTLVGHTSAEGNRAFNRYLGRQRARAARTLLVGRGAPAGAFATRSAGAAEPLVNGAAGEAAAANRRVVLEVKCP
jgi:outer membrane protein OmpA-like peptidoglycan-associated protein